MSKQSILGLKPLFELDSFNEVMRKAGISNTTSGLNLFDKLLYVFDNDDLYRTSFHSYHCWANIALYQGFYQLAYELQYQLFVYQRFNSLTYSTKPNSFKDFLSVGTKEVNELLWWIMLPSDDEQLRNDCVKCIDEYTELSQKRNLEPLQLELPIIGYRKVAGRHLQYEVSKKYILKDCDLYNKYIETILGLQCEMPSLCKKSLGGLSDNCKKFVSSGALFGVLFFGLLSGKTEDLFSLADQDDWRIFSELKRRELRGIQNELSVNKIIPDVYNVPYMGMLTGLWKEGKTKSKKDRKKILLKINRCVNNWIKDGLYVENDGNIRADIPLWSPLLFRFVVLADLEIDTEDSLDFFKVFKHFGDVFPSVRERYCLDESNIPELIPIEDIAQQVYDRYIVDLDGPVIPPLFTMGQEERVKAFDVYQKENTEFQIIRAKRLKEMQEQRELKNKKH